MDWLRIFKHLLPRAKAWSLTIDKTLRKFFDGFSKFADDVVGFADDVFCDLDPKKTRALDAWEKQFGLSISGLTTQQRRDRLAATWKALGGQSPRYIQDTLKAAGFDVYVHEWWEPGSNPPVVRNPLLYLDDGTGGIPFVMRDGEETSTDGGITSSDGATLAPVGYPLVNKIILSLQSVVGDGNAAMRDGAFEARDGGVIATNALKQYIIPNDADKWPYFVYIGGQTFPEQAFVSESRRDEFEKLCLKICPAHLWIGVLVTYS